MLTTGSSCVQEFVNYVKLRSSPALTKAWWSPRLAALSTVRHVSPMRVCVSHLDPVCVSVSVSDKLTASCIIRHLHRGISSVGHSLSLDRQPARAGQGYALVGATRDP